MSFLALPFGIFLWYLLGKQFVEKVQHPIFSRIISGLVCLIVLITVTKIQAYREENYNFWLGILPSFLTAIGFPFAFIVLGYGVKPIFYNSFISWATITFAYLAIYEVVLWLDGRNFDIIDILFTIIGAIISGVILSKLEMKLNLSQDNHQNST